MTLELGEADDGKVVRLAPGDTVTIVLPENASTGYRWSLEGPVAPLLTVEDEPVAPQSGVAPGAGAVRRFRISAQAPGEVMVRLQLSRKWEGEAGVTQRYAVRLQIAPPA